MDGYLGYGDLQNNRGPVDIVSYDPVSNTLRREMLDIPEEQVVGWHTHSRWPVLCRRPRLQEKLGHSGSFYVDDGLGWQKRRHNLQGLHVGGCRPPRPPVCKLHYDGVSPVTYTFALVSNDQGASWTYEPVDRSRSNTQ